MKYTDAEWIAKVHETRTPLEMLKIIVENEHFLGYDSYYKNLRAAIMKSAEVIIRDSYFKDNERSKS